MTDIAQKKERSTDLVAIQMLRGIAAFWVMLSHSIPNEFGKPDNIIVIIARHGWMGVQIFFIISGYIIPFSMHKNNYKISDFKTFFFKRIVRIEPPYIASIILVLFLNWSNTISPWYKGPAYTFHWGNILGHLGYLNAFTGQPWLDVAYWTLAIEFQFYIILALCYPLFTYHKKWVLLLALPGFTTLSLCAIPFYLLSNNTVYFAMGITLFLYHVNKITFLQMLMLMVYSFCICFFLHQYLLIFICLATLLCINYLKKVPKILILLGAISYSLYLTHAVIVSRVAGLLRHYLHTGAAFDSIVGIIVCLAFATIFYLLIEKPFQLISKRLTYKHKARLFQPRVNNNPT